MNIEEARKQFPELAGSDDEQVVDAIHQAYYPDLPREQIAESLGYKAAPPPPEPRTFGGTVKDIALTGLKGIIGVPEAAVGLADIATGGYAGKAAEAVGFRPKEAKAALDEEMSPAQKHANDEVQHAEGFWNTFKAAISNPSVVGHSVVESLPSMLGGGVVSRGLMGASGMIGMAGKLSPVLAGALGEGVVQAGSAAEQSRQDDPNGLLTGKATVAALASGAIDSVIGRFSGGLAKKLGIADVDTMLAGAATNPKAAKGVVRSALEGMFTEGILEELPQSVQEQVWANYAAGKPLDEGVNQAAVLGMLSGAAMGGGANVLDHLRKPPQTPATDILKAPDTDSAIAAAGAALRLPAPVIAVTQAGTAVTSEQRGKLVADELFDRAARGGVRETVSPFAKDNVQDVNARDVVESDTGTRAADLMGAKPNPLMDAARERESNQRKDDAYDDYAAELASDDNPILASDITRPSGQPFGTEKAARLRAMSVPNAAVVPVAGGFVVRPGGKDPQTNSGVTNAQEPRGDVGQRLSREPAAATAGAQGQTGRADGNLLERNDGARPGQELAGERDGLPGVVRADGGIAVAEPAQAGGAGVAGDDSSVNASNVTAPAGGRLETDHGPVKGAPIDGAWTAFSPDSKTKGIPRADMPQIKAEHRGAMVQFLKGRGIEHEQEHEVDPASLKPTQAEYSPDKVMKALDYTEGDRAILVSADNHILDGHHQWLAALATKQPIRVIRLNAPIAQLLRTVKEFPSATQADGATEAAPAAPAAVPANQGQGDGDDAGANRPTGETGAPQQPDGALSDTGTWWAGASEAERRALLGRTAAKGKSQDRISKKEWADLEPGWQRSIEREYKLAPPAKMLPNATAPEHVETGVDDRELGEIVAAFNDAQARMLEGDEPMTHVFDHPKPADVVRLNDKVRVYMKDHGWMTPAQAKARIEEWKEKAAAQGDDAQSNGNSQRIVLSLFDKTGKWSQPWEDAGYQVYRFDIQNDPEFGDVNKFDTEFFNDNFGSFDGQDVYAILAACPCTDFAVSGARHFAAKDEDGRTVASVQLVHQTLATIEYFKPAVWALENPVGRIERLGGLPHWRLSFDPNHLGDPYTKKTLIWGRFNGDLPIAPVEPTEGSKMHSQFGGKSQKTKDARSQTPEGFSYGFFAANNAVDNPAMAIANKFDRLDRGLIEQAVAAGITEQAIESAVEDFYYQDLDNEAANSAIRDLIKEKGPTGSPTVPRETVGTNSETSPAATKPKPAASANTVFTDDMAEKARARLKAKLGRLSSNPLDPEMMLDGITLAGYHLEKGARTFAAFAKAMVADLGDGIKPYLKSWYSALRYDPRAAPFVTGMSSSSMVEEFDLADVAAYTGGQDGTATRKLDSASEGSLAGEPAGDVRTPGEGGDAGAQPGAGGNGDVGSDGPPAGGRGDVGGSVGSGAGGSSLPEAGAGRAPRGPRKPRIQGAPRDDAGAGLFDDAGGTGGLSPAPNAAPAPAPQFKLEDFTIEDDFALGEGGQKTKFKNNVAAIRLLRDLEAADRHATADEQQVLAKYVGWGGLPQAFDANNADWGREFAELSGLLSPEDFAAARQSTRYAHYTSRAIIQDGIYAALRRFGFNGGRVLEGGAGVGNFIGLMPQDMRSAGRVTAVEREPIAAGIAKYLYPNQAVHREDFTEFKGTDAYYDAAVGNPPFASDPQVDRSGRKHLSGLSLHNYFFAKEVDMLREGGVLAQVVTNSFMDAKGDRARKYISDRTKFLGAIRLPNNAFSKNAGTEVTTDLIFLQKRPESEFGNKQTRADAAAWLDTGAYKGVALNQYFIDHPDMMLGDFGPHGTMYGPDQPALVARSGQDTLALLREAVQKLPQGVFVDRAVLGTTQATEAAVQALNNPPVQEGGFFNEGGKLMQRLPDIAGEARGVEITPETMWTAKTKLGADGFARISALADMRTTLRGLLAAELAGDMSPAYNDDDGKPAAKMDVLRRRLNTQYDAFTKAHGLLGDQSTARVFDDDPDFPLLLSLEHNYARGISPTVAKKQGIQPFKSSAKKAPIFNQRVIDARKQVQKVESPEDALAVSMAERGKLDTAYIGKLLNKDPEDVLRELSTGDKPLLFLDPATDEYVLRDAYLSGNVRAKLLQAKQSGLSINERELERVQPEDVGAHEIVAKVGSPWVPTSVYEDFARELLGPESEASIKYVKLNGSYSVYTARANEVMNTNKWGTKSYSAAELLAALLNNRAIKVTYRDSEGKTHTDIEATEQANVKGQEIKDRFSDWLFADATRSELLTRAYNDTNNNYVTRKYDGSWMTFPGKVPDSVIAFRRHQRNAIARIVQDRTALLDHVVGSGKTFTTVAAAMELRRTGLARKPMVTVPNHLVKQWAADFYRLYPGANVLTATKKDFEKINRRKFLAKIATGDWDAVVIAHSSFGFIKPSPEFEAGFNEKQVALVMATIQQVRDGDGDKAAKKRTVKQLEGMKERLENRIKSLRDKAMDDLLDFEQIGVDQLFVDEAHMFKNLMFTTKMQNVAGLGDAKGAQRAYDMYVKSQQIFAQNGRGQGLVFATGTPVSNSLAEKYHMMRYLMPKQMDDLGFQSFDAWANTFASVEQVWMQKASGDGYKPQNRMSQFVNVHELLKMFDQVADTVTQEDVNKAYSEENNGAAFPIPPLKTGRRQPVSLDKSPAQEAYMAEIAVRAKILEARKGPPQKGQDNILVIMSDARKAAMDIRLVDLDRKDREPGGRLDRATDEIMDRYHQYARVRGTQLVFSDLGTPKKHAQAELKEYEALKARMDKATEEVHERAAFGAEDAQAIIDDAEEAAAEMEANGSDWQDAVKAALRGFSVYDDLKQALMERGVLEHEIAFIHDYNTDERKATLFRKTNRGEIRVVMGSTSKMGAGTNVQERVVAEHHLDVPWRPSDVEQREGRVIRQGNVLIDPKHEDHIPGFEVEILAYVTKDTLDMRMWQIQETKLKMINQLRTRKVGREIDNAFEDMEMSAGEMQAAATGNMDLLREIQARTDIKKLEQKKRSFEAQKNDLINRKKSVEEKLRTLPAQLADATVLAEGAAEYDKALADQSAAFTVEIDGKEYTDASEAGKYLLGKVDAQIYVRTVEKDGKKVREEMSEDQRAALAAEMERLDAGTAKERAEGEEKRTYMLSFDPKAAPIDVTMNGVVYTARAKLQEAWSEARGDRDPIAWTTPDGQTLNRRAAITTALRGPVADAIADERPVSIGKVGPFAVTVEGGTDKHGNKHADVVLEYKGKTIEGDISVLSEDGAAKVAELIVTWADRKASNAASDKRWIEQSLESAKKAQKELAGADALTDWPEQGKLDAARAAHKEIRDRLNKADAKAGNMGTPIVMTGKEYGDKFGSARAELAGRYVITTEGGGGFPGVPRDGFATKAEAQQWITENGPPPAAGETPMFDQSFSQPSESTRKQVGKLQAVVDAISEGWARAPRITVVPSVNSPSVPLAIRTEAQRAIANGGGVPRGVFYLGEVWLFADRITSDKQAATVVFHEINGHFGLRGRFGAELDKVLAQVAALRPADIRKMIEKTGMDPDDLATVHRAAEEVLAYMAQENPNLTLVQRAVAAIRNWLREHIPGLDRLALTDNDIVQGFLMPARQFVEGGGGPNGGMRMAFQSASKPFYSALARGIEAVPAKALPVAGWQGAINAMVNKGAAKADEVEWSGLREWLALQDGKVGKDAVLDYLNANGVKVTEMVKGQRDLNDTIDTMIVELDALGFTVNRQAAHDGEMVIYHRETGQDVNINDDGDVETDDGERITGKVAELVANLGSAIYEGGEYIDDGFDATKYHQYTLPGGENYKELLLTLPSKQTATDEHRAFVARMKSKYPGTLQARANAMTEGEALELKRLGARANAERETPDYSSNHWDEQNILAHIRMNERTDADGNKVLFVEEIQSDWAQEGKRKGFDTGEPAPAGWANTGNARGTGVVPSAPFVGKTDAWVTLALKRVIKQAVDIGADKVAFVTGQQSADRYDLSKQVDSIVYRPFKDADNEGILLRLEKNGKTIAQPLVKPEDLSDHVGKELARKILAGEGESVAWNGYKGAQVESKRLSGVDLKVGGEGMMAFYDKIIPAAANKLLAKIGGGKVAGVKIEGHNSGGVSGDDAMQAAGIPLNERADYWKKLPQSERDAMIENLRDIRLTQPGFDITPAMREAAEDGLPLFSQAPSKAKGDTPMFSQLDGIDSPRAAYEFAKAELRELHKSPGKIHWWHKTVGTQYSLADKHPQFKRVFDRVQDFLNDVSVFATNAADKAPSILPKLESWRDITKTALSAADTKAIQAPIFEGTLMWARGEDGKPVKVAELEADAKRMTAQEKAQEMLRRRLISPNILAAWNAMPLGQYEKAVNTRYESTVLKEGVVWSDAELRSQFKLNDKQIGLYKEFRASVDDSLTHLSISNMVRYAGKDLPDNLRRDAMALNDVGAAAALIRAHLMELVEAQPKRDAVLTKAITKIAALDAQANDLMEHGYAPLSRFGTYTVDVVQNGERVFFSLYESRYDAMRAAAKMKDLYPGASIQRGTTSQEEYKLFAGVSPETMELFGEMLGLESDGTGAKDRAFQEYIKLAKSTRSAMKRLIHRKGIEGFSEDAGRVLAGFVYSNARQTSKNLHMGEIDEMAAGIDKGQGELKDAAVKLADYIKNPVEEAHRLRGLLFAQYLGGSIAAAMVNMTQPFAITMPYLSQWGGIAAAGKQMARAAKDATKDSTGDKALDAAMKRAADEGIVAPQEVHQLMAQAAGRGSLKAGDGTALGEGMAFANNALSRLELAWGKPFATAELFNRRTTFIAAWRTATEQGIENPYAFAVKAITETQFLYNKGNKPTWARGALGSTLFTFKQYSISYLELLQRMATAGEAGSPERAAGRRAALFAMAMMLMMGGAGGLPFVEDVEDVVDGVAQRLGYNLSIKDKRQQLFQEAFGKALGGFLERGVSGVPGVPIDVAGRLGMGNLVPGTGLLKKKTDHTRDVTEVLGPAADLATRVAQGANLATSGRPLDGLMSFQPTAARNLAKAFDMATSGQYKDERGYKVLDVDAYDAIAKGIGFQPSDVAKVQKGDRSVQEMIAVTRLRESEISAQWAKAISEGDQSGVQKARAELLDWNEKNPDTPIKIRLADILKRAKSMRMGRDERIEKSAPKEIRAEAHRRLIDGRE